MKLQSIQPCSFEDTSSESHPFWGGLGYSKAARFEAKSETEIELNAYPLIKSSGTQYPGNQVILYDILSDGSYAFSSYVMSVSNNIASFRISTQTSWKTIYDVLNEAPFVDGLEVNKDTNGHAWTRFKKPFAPNGRGGDSVEILDNFVEAHSYASFMFDEIPVGQDELFYVRDIFPDYDYSLPPSSFCKKLHFSVTTENVKIRIKEESIDDGDAWEDGASSVQTFRTKMLTYYCERVPYVTIRGQFTKYAYGQMKYTFEYGAGIQDVMWVKF